MRMPLALSLCLLISGFSGAQCTPTELTTSFTSNNGQDGNMFDIVALNDVTVCTFDINVDPGSWNVEVYALPTNMPYASAATNAAAWGSPLDSLTVISQGTDVPTPLQLSLGVDIPAGNVQAFYITLTQGGAINYINGGTTGSVYVADANIQILEGAGVDYPFVSTFEPRAWSGAVHYCVGLGQMCGTVIRPYQTNSPDANLGIDAGSGAPQSIAVLPAVTMACAGAPLALQAASAGLAGLGYEIAVVPGALAPSVLTTAGNQVANIDPTAASWLNGGASPSFAPFAPLNIGFTLPGGAVASVQMMILDPSHPDGFRLSQGAQVNSAAGASATNPAAGPTGDDQTLQYVFASQPICGPNLPFYGTTYSECFVSSNGRVSFVAPDADFSPTLSEVFSDTPFYGFWTDQNPSAGGAIRIEIALRGGKRWFDVVWDNVPYFGNPGGNTYTVSLAEDGEINMHFASVLPNTGGTGGGDAQFVGASNGNLGPGMSTGSPAPFTTTPRTETGGEAIFDFWDGNTATAPSGDNFLQSVQNALAAPNRTLALVPNAAGTAYTGSLN